MKNSVSFTFKILLTTALIFPQVLFFGATDSSLLTGTVLKAQEKTETKRKTRKTPAMRERVYSQLARAQKLADEDKIAEGLAVLDKVKTRINQLNSYEKAMLWNFYGFIHYGNEDSANALKAFENVVAQENIPESLEKSTLFSLAQLNMAADAYDKTLKYLSRWQAVKGEPLNNNGLVLKANAYYALKDYAASEKVISQAVEAAFAEGKLPKENWLVLKRALHYELKQIDKVTQVSEDLVRHYSKPKYWVELANMYGETNQSQKQMAVMEAAYQQGYVTKSKDLQSLAQLYFFAEAPYKAAKLLSENIETGRIDTDVKVLRFLAQAWTVAKEPFKAIPVLQQAAELSSDGNMDLKLAEAYVAVEHWKQVIEATQTAEKKGKLDNRGNLYIARGMAQFNLKNYNAAIKSFETAKLEKRQRKIANQWLKYAKSEKLKQEKLDQSLASLGQ